MIEAANSSCAGAADAGAANIPEIKIKDSDKVINPKILVIIVFISSSIDMGDNFILRISHPHRTADRELPSKGLVLRSSPSQKKRH